ncbi:hypothetical protein RhiirA5_60848 [Rhizophagus irregularis]|uniref:Transmembrane protein n=1 Tax=Rhizophagus irregularis TaxID=588596 RepID=A0A2N0P251_9GLOM|nr:hypothetical protein RhiirA5_60848 [Rhizophagus irregularis]
MMLQKHLRRNFLFDSTFPTNQFFIPPQYQARSLFSIFFFFFFFFFFLFFFFNPKKKKKKKKKIILNTTKNNRFLFTLFVHLSVDTTKKKYINHFSLFHSLYYIYIINSVSFIINKLTFFLHQGFSPL